MGEISHYLGKSRRKGKRHEGVLGLQGTGFTPYPLLPRVLNGDEALYGEIKKLWHTRNQGEERLAEGTGIIISWSRGNSL